MYIFISYSHVDRSLAKKVALRLDKESVRYFLDEKSINYGSDIHEEIKSSMREVTHLIVVISPASLRSQWASYEVGLAASKGITIIPFISHPALELPSFISGKKGFSQLSQISSYIKSEMDNLNAEVRPNIEVPEEIEILWLEILSEDFIDSAKSKEYVWDYFSKWRDCIRDVKYKDYGPEHAFYGGTEHYLMGYLSHVIKYIQGDIPREEVNRYRVRTRETICNGKYPKLERL